MKASLLLPEGRSPVEALPAFARDALRSDLKLNLFLDAASQGDLHIREALDHALMAPLQDMKLIAHRHEVLRDAMAYPMEFDALYRLCLEADRRNKGSLGTVNWMSNYDAAGTFAGAVESLMALVEVLKKLLRLSEEWKGKFRSSGILSLLQTLCEGLSDRYLREVKRGLAELNHPESFLVSAKLGSHLQGVEYRLLRPRGSLAGLGALAYRTDENDKAAEDFAVRKARGVNELSNVLAGTAVSMITFFDRLRSELAFYKGCLNFKELMESMGLPVCFPTLLPMEADSRKWYGLYDVALAVLQQGSVVGNDYQGEHKDLYLICGANQGGKTTFLRSIGTAQLMAQCGMLVPARAFVAPLRNAVFSHFKREEDRWMVSGKLEEELARMRRITDHIRSGGLLLMNESFSSTGEREGGELMRQLMAALSESSVEIFSVSHLYSGVRAFQDRKNVQFLQAQREKDGRRSFRIIPGEPDETAFAEEIFREVFS